MCRSNVLRSVWSRSGSVKRRGPWRSSLGRSSAVGCRSSSWRWFVRSAPTAAACSCRRSSSASSAGSAISTACSTRSSTPSSTRTSGPPSARSSMASTVGAGSPGPARGVDDRDTGRAANSPPAPRSRPSPPTSPSSVAAPLQFLCHSFRSRS